MHGQLLNHFAKRSVQMATDSFNQQSLEQPQPHDGHEPAIGKLPKMGVAVIGSTIIGFVLMLTLIRYTLWGVIGTLAMVEQPQTTYIVKEEKNKKADDQVTAEEAIDTDVLVIKQKPVTSKIRATIQHLHAHGGFLARWRGLVPFAFYTVLQSFTAQFIGHLIPLPHGCGASVIGSVLSSVLLLRLGTAWVHIVISEPSTKSWFRRLPTTQAFKVLWLPTVITDLAVHLSAMIPMTILLACRMHQPPETLEHREITIAASKLFAVLVLGLVCFFGLAVPCGIALTRMQASMLPEEHESIVPFDRTFGGRLVPEIIGGSGAVGMKEAWQTFDRSARLRFVKLAIKFGAIDLMLHMLFFVTVGFQLYYLIGPEKLQQIAHEHRKA
ncbi:MAG: hypothetical protein M1831_007410 [Alyxoria varia]|nr:MAG: hypothetical protein M1831_007410 [Alyxoria varia]